MWLPELWVYVFLGRPLVAQPDAGEFRIGIERYRSQFVVEVVEWPTLLCHLGRLFAVDDVMIRWCVVLRLLLA